MTLPESFVQVQMDRSYLLAALDVANKQVEQLQVQLAGCLTAAEGGTRPEVVAVRGAYGWSLAYQQTLDLRRGFDAALRGPPFGNRRPAMPRGGIITPMSKRRKSHGLGRLAAPDLRDHKFLIRPRAVAGIDTREWVNHGIWDQGNTPQCVAYSSLKWLTAGPIANKATADQTAEFYKRCQQNDEWDGEDYEGTSVRAAFKVLQARGFIQSYYWAFDVAAAANFILSTGPMVFGTIWTEAMFEPVRGILPPDLDSPIAGGHAYLIIGVNKKIKCPDKTLGAFRVVNSWGSSWGQSGRAWLPFSLADKLFKEDGEAVCATEIKVKNVAPV
jgi:hypothetical protein